MKVPSSKGTKSGTPSTTNTLKTSSRKASGPRSLVSSGTAVSLGGEDCSRTTTAASPEASPWTRYGLAERPRWWHYWEERQGELPEPPPHPPVERPPPVEIPGEDADSQEWTLYWLTKRMQESLAAAAPPGPPAAQDFSAPPLVDGPWNASHQVSRLVLEGFKISADLTRRGRAPPRLKCRDAEERAYVEAMIRDGVVSPGEPEFSVPHFFLRRGTKLRLIFDGRKLNAAIAPPPKFNMKSHRAIANLVHRFSWHAADDLSNMFFSIPIAESCRPLFGLRTSLGSFVYNKLPFGFSWAPFIAHIAVDQIAKRAIEAGHAVTHYLDDFHYFGDTPQEALEARTFVRGLFEQAGWKVNLKKAEEPSQVFQALGINYDAAAKCARAPEKQLLKLWFAHSELLKGKATLKQLQSILGSLVFFTNAAQGSLFLCEPLIAVVSDMARKGVRAIPYAKVAPAVATAIIAFDKAGWFPILRAEEPPLQVFTDATPTQIAFVVGKVVKAKTIKRKQIFRAEADAILWMLRTARLPSSFTINCDNLPLVHALRKGRSAIKEAHNVCKEIFKLRAKGKFVGIKYIPTDINPADAPSRAAPAA